MLKPEVRVFAGPNGSGKTTFATREWIIEPYINADVIKAEQGLSDMEAAVRAERLRENALERGISFTFETVLSTERNLLLLERAREAGYFIKVYYILTRNPIINIARVKSRVSEGGHDVPTDKIKARFYRCMNLIPRLYDVCDILHIYDNSGNDSPSRIVRKHKDSLTIFPNKYWSKEQIFELIGKK